MAVAKGCQQTQFLLTVGLNGAGLHTMQYALFGQPFNAYVAKCNVRLSASWYVMPHISISCVDAKYGSLIG